LNLHALNRCCPSSVNVVKHIMNIRQFNAETNLKVDTVHKTTTQKPVTTLSIHPNAASVINIIQRFHISAKVDPNLIQTTLASLQHPSNFQSLHPRHLTPTSIPPPTIDQVISFITLTFQNLYPFQRESILHLATVAAKEIFKVQLHATYSGPYVFFSVQPLTPVISSL